MGLDGCPCTDPDDNKPWDVLNLSGELHTVLIGDSFPNDPLEWADSDNDSVGDNRDFMPREASQQYDSDGDSSSSGSSSSNGERPSRGRSSSRGERGNARRTIKIKINAIIDIIV